MANVYFNENTGISRVQIPKALAMAFGIGKGSKVDFKVVEGKIQLNIVK